MGTTKCRAPFHILFGVGMCRKRGLRTRRDQYRLFQLLNLDKSLVWIFFNYMMKISIYPLNLRYQASVLGLWSTFLCQNKLEFALRMRRDQYRVFQPFKPVQYLVRVFFYDDMMVTFRYSRIEPIYGLFGSWLCACAGSVSSFPAFQTTVQILGSSLLLWGKYVLQENYKKSNNDSINILEII